MNHYSDFREDITKCLEVLNSGGIILYPTDTIWGLGCDATRPESVEKIYKIKQRKDTRSMLVLLDNEGKLESYTEQVPDIAWQLIEVSDNPLTIIYPEAKNLAKNLIAADGSIGVRITREAFSSELIRRFKKPLVSTSANISGQPSPENFLAISNEIKEKADYVVRYRQDDTSASTPSSIIKTEINGEFRILRK